MRKMCKMAFAAAVMMTMLLVSCQKADFSAAYEYVKTEKAYQTKAEGLQVEIELGCLEKEDDRNLAVYQLEAALKNARDFLGSFCRLDEPIQCRILSGDGFTTLGDRQLDIYYYETVPQPYTNYMIQILAGFETADWLREGLAAYGADQMGESLLDSYAASLTELDFIRTREEEEGGSKAKVTELAKALYAAEAQSEAAKLGDLLMAVSEFTEAEEAGKYRGAYCIYAGSFVEYLTDKMGLDAVMQIYQGADFSQVMGKSLEAARQGWIKERLTD